MMEEESLVQCLATLKAQEIPLPVIFRCIGEDRRRIRGIRKLSPACIHHVGVSPVSLVEAPVADTESQSVMEDPVLDSRLRNITRIYQYVALLYT